MWTLTPSAPEPLTHELRDLSAQDLTHLVARQFGDDDQLAGESVVGDGLFRPGAYFLKSQWCTGTPTTATSDTAGWDRIAASTWEG